MENIGLIYRYFLCSIFSATVLSVMTIIATISTNFHIIAFFVFSFYYFICYVLFAIPIQILLNRTPKKHNFTYLLIYLFGAFATSALVIIVLFDETPFITIGYYFISIFGSLVFWFFDSILLQKNKR